MDYEKLDDILKFLQRSQGYAGWSSYANYVRVRDNLLADTINNDRAYAGWCNSLLHWGLVDYRYNPNELHTFIITPKGLELLRNEKSTRDIHQEFLIRERLENRILEGTIESHQIGKIATKLNKLQLVVTVILGIVSAGTIFFQYESNQLTKRAIEVSEKAYALEMDNKDKIDTIFVKMKLPGDTALKK